MRITRCVVPVFGNRWRDGAEWSRRRPGWAIGMWKASEKVLGFRTTGEVEGGAALISEQDGERRRLILVDAATAIRWLLAEGWEAEDMLKDKSLRLGALVDS